MAVSKGLLETQSVSEHLEDGVDSAPLKSSSTACCSYADAFNDSTVDNGKKFKRGVDKTDVEKEVFSKTVNCNLSEEEQKKMKYRRAVRAFLSYRLHSLKKIFRTVQYINSLPSHHQELLKSYRSHLNNVRTAVDHNYKVLKMIIQDVDKFSQILDNDRQKVAHADMEKVQCILKQLYREWSVEGEEERNASFSPILQEISSRYPASLVNCADIHIIVPGAGLGRLPYEIAKRGYYCHTNEICPYMFLVAKFMLSKERCKSQEFKIYPWVHQCYNNLKSDHQVQAFQLPDVDVELLSNVDLIDESYVKYYKDPDTADCVITCFFLDTGNNVVDYIQTTWNVLKPGGYWINLGPLLYHLADFPADNCIQLSYEDIKGIILKCGFTMLKEETNLATPYCQNRCAMMSDIYNSVFFVCQKPESQETVT